MRGGSTWTRLITSQNATAPKHRPRHGWKRGRLITSQNATAPKHLQGLPGFLGGLITSQNATAPKQKLAYAIRNAV